ncbi:AAA family ATPase [Hydrogenophaga soli]
MKAIAVVNPKGGAGKSTLATNLAGHLARQGAGVMLGDVDRQQSSRHWLAARDEGLPRIETWEIGPDDIARPPKGLWRAVLDTPAGLSGKALEKVVKASSKLVVPVLPSPFDLWATQAFLDEVLAIKRVANGKADVAIVGMRVQPHTRAADELRAFFARQGIPAVATLRATQLYPRLALLGQSIFDVNESLARRELEDWQPLLDWLARD